MKKPNILLGMTGSVATTLAPKIIESLSDIGNVKIILTESALPFVDVINLKSDYKVFRDKDEWSADGKYHKDDPVLHIDLRKWADVFVIVPLTANSLAKIANGFCDNLLTNVFRAWDWTRPVVMAPAMNTLMWENPPTVRHLLSLQMDFGDSLHVVLPQIKKLACNDEGEGALANIDVITEKVNDSLKWVFPLSDCSGIPISYHPGAFGFARKHSNHTGVDLYASQGRLVTAVEGGTVVSVEHFTGPKDGSPWWNDTDCVLVEGRTGVVCYGEITSDLKVGDKVKRGARVGKIETVLLDGKERPDIPGHSRAMLHFEMYQHGVKEASRSWKQGREELHMIDPTPYLIDSMGAPKRLLTWDNEKKPVTS
tara:strand:- start:139 stop:1242 length:1104 start_codon:yes stop_codon:yes gene_type:complete